MITALIVLIVCVVSFRVGWVFGRESANLDHKIAELRGEAERRWEVER